MAHHKSNKAVEGNPDTGHGGGLPRRPDERDLEERTEEERAEAGLDPEADAGPDAQYADEEAEVDREAGRGEVATDAGTHRKARENFPPTGYPT
ncbi:hypothetical protein [Streptacidiphilus sp. P02-A3a]|uniref:hypothetical protein n=1 Tax=Streptacidiphilus sp. P02-A3a TaxID=2704468 RepID=UPI0015FE34A7|nr:hypothetical protein [Streptacidiphilus sp. P02-A3a]QMU67420.1 hypothetical protein GXP74_03495 [Streptacidiphilus sp. P02-A3a]